MIEENLYFPQIQEIIDKYRPETTIKDKTMLIQNMFTFIKTQNINKIDELKTTQMIEMQYILKNHKELTKTRLDTTNKWSMTMTLIQNMIKKSTDLIIHDGRECFPIDYEGEALRDFFGKTHLLVGLLVNIPFDTFFIKKFLAHMDTWLWETKSHMLIIIPSNKFQKQKHILNNIGYSELKFENPLLFYRGTNLEVYNTCPTPINIIALNVENWNQNIQNDIMGMFQHKLKKLPAQPHLKTACFYITKAKTELLQKEIEKIPTFIQNNHQLLEKNATTFKNLFDNELAILKKITN